MYKSNKLSETSEVRERLWNWMIKANGERKWFAMRAEIVEIILKEAAKVRAQKGYVTYIINTQSEGVDPHDDGKIIRRFAIDNNVNVFTCLDTVKVLLDVLEEITMGISVINEE